MRHSRFWSIVPVYIENAETVQFLTYKNESVNLGPVEQPAITTTNEKDDHMMTDNETTTTTTKKKIV
jgi:hypothetical protein